MRPININTVKPLCSKLRKLKKRHSKNGKFSPTNKLGDLFKRSTFSHKDNINKIPTVLKIVVKNIIPLLEFSFCYVLTNFGLFLDVSFLKKSNFF